MNKCLCNKGLLPSTLWWLLGLCCPVVLNSVENQQSTNISPETGKEDTGKTFFPPVLGIHSRTFVTVLGITKDKFLSNMKAQCNAYLPWWFVKPHYGSLVIMTQISCPSSAPDTHVEALPCLLTLLFIRVWETKIGFVYMISMWCSFLCIVQILPGSF